MTEFLTLNRKKISELLYCALYITLILLYACGSNSDTSYSPSSHTGSIPMLLAPSNGSTVKISRFSFKWNSVAGASEYQIQSSTDSSFASIVIDKTVTSTSYTPITPVTPDDISTTVFDNVLSYNGPVYAVTEEPMTWQEAKILAKQHGGYLVTINDADENQFLTDNYPTLPSEQWIGYTDKDDEGTWIWANGETATYTNWESWEPNDYRGVEDCANIQTSGKWHDVPCTDVRRAIVEWESTLNSNLPLSAGTYYWRVKAKDSYGNESEWSEVWSFTVSSEPGIAETEPNNDMDHADSLGSGESIIGQLSSEGDEDWFSISTSGADIINAYFHTDIVYDNDYWYISILDASGNELTKVGCCRYNQETEFHVAVSGAGTYYILITKYSIGSFYSYREDSYMLTVSLF